MSNPNRSTAMRSGGRRGNAILEFALVSTVLSILLFGVMDYGRIFGFAEQTTNAANAGAAFAGLSVANSANLTAITAAAKADAPDVANAMTVSTASFCTCAFGGAHISCSSSCVYGTKRGYLQVNTAVPFRTLARYPFLPGSTTLRARAIVRIQ